LEHSKKSSMVGIVVEASALVVVAGSKGLTSAARVVCFAGEWWFIPKISVRRF
jgi:hypothetical protein